MSELNGMRVLVTGATSGLGAAMAAALARSMSGTTCRATRKQPTTFDEHVDSSPRVARLIEGDGCGSGR